MGERSFSPELWEGADCQHAPVWPITTCIVAFWCLEVYAGNKVRAKALILNNRLENCHRETWKNSNNVLYTVVLTPLSTIVDRSPQNHNSIIYSPSC